MNFTHFCEFWCFFFFRGKHKNNLHWTFVLECPCEKFMNWPFFALVCRGYSWHRTPARVIYVTQKETTRETFSSLCQEAQKWLSDPRSGSKVAKESFKVIFREKQRGGETQGRGKHTINPLPKNGFGPPHLWYDFPPPLCSRNVILLRGNGHRPDKSHFLRPPKLGLEGVLYGTFSPPKITRYVLPPPFANSQIF